MVGFEVIHYAAQTPRPCADRAPLVRCGFGLPRLQILCPDAEPDSTEKVRFDIAIVDSRHAKAFRQQVIDLHASESPAARRRYLLLLAVPHLTQLDLRIVEDRGIRRKVDCQK